jgi:hypothetical protein
MGDASDGDPSASREAKEEAAAAEAAAAPARAFWAVAAMRARKLEERAGRADGVVVASSPAASDADAVADVDVPRAEATARAAMSAMRDPGDTDPAARRERKEPEKAMRGGEAGATDGDEVPAAGAAAPPPASSRLVTAVTSDTSGDGMTGGWRTRPPAAPPPREVEDGERDTAPRALPASSSEAQPWERAGECGDLALSAFAAAGGDTASGSMRIFWRRGRRDQRPARFLAGGSSDDTPPSSGAGCMRFAPAFRERIKATPPPTTSAPITAPVAMIPIVSPEPRMGEVDPSSAPAAVPLPGGGMGVGVGVSEGRTRRTVWRVSVTAVTEPCGSDCTSELRSAAAAAADA